jgi:hypothetical protein
MLDDQNNNYGSWRHLSLVDHTMMLLAPSTRELAMKLIIEHKTVATKPESRPQLVPDSRDFSEARHLLLLASREAGNQKKLAFRSLYANDGRDTFLASTNVVEEVLYWFISAPALGYLIYLVLGF